MVSFPRKATQRYAEMAAPCQINTPLTALSMNVAYSVSSGQCPNAALQAILWRGGLPAERLQVAAQCTRPARPHTRLTDRGPLQALAASMNTQFVRSLWTTQARRRMP